MLLVNSNASGAVSGENGIKKYDFPSANMLQIKN